MPGELLLDTRYVTIHQKDIILVTNQEGWIGEERTGLYHLDTRYVSHYQLLINGFAPRFLGASLPRYFSSVFYYTNPRIGGDNQKIESDSILITVRRYIYGGVHEDIEVTNYAGRPLQLILSLHLDSDFADIFQVRGLEQLIPRIAQARWDRKKSSLYIRYRKADFQRQMSLQVDCVDTPAARTLNSFTFRMDLEAGRPWKACVLIHLEDDTAPGHEIQHSLDQAVGDVKRWRAGATRVETAAQPVQRAYDQALLDMASLRLEEMEEFGDDWFPSAGVPWYVAIFGRDSLITAIQTLPIHSRFGPAVLERLQQLQGTRKDDWTEEEPGKLPHELRRGELVAFGKIPHKPYYGSVDCPLLFVVLLHELYRFTGNIDLAQRFAPAARACLEWANRYGDIDGDGFIEYRPLSPKGYRNQAWKDSSDAVVYPDGTLVEPPIAICEVQGYHYDALRHMSALERLLGRHSAAEEYDERARELFQRFNDTFWLPEEGAYAYCLDPNKRIVPTAVSNIGHLLWSGIAPDDRAALVAERLMKSDMFSGWGIRTLSAENPAFDPLSYHRGSIWPHDNAIIASGFKRYGFWEKANTIAEAIFAAASRYRSHSLPEVFAGLERASSLPIPYSEANLPQAWASGSIFMLLAAILGLAPDPMRRKLCLSPTLPGWLPELTLRNLTVFGQALDLRFSGRGPATSVETLRNEGGIEIEVRH